MEFSLSRTVRPDVTSPFVNLLAKVSLKCLSLLQEELTKCKCATSHDPQKVVGCAFTTTMGIPNQMSMHELYARGMITYCSFHIIVVSLLVTNTLMTGENITLEEVHVFWRTLTYDPNDEFAVPRHQHDQSIGPEEQLTYIDLWC